LLSGQNIPEAIHSVNREGDIPHSLANISKAKIELDYEPAVPIKEGLAFTCATFINLNKR
jgi:nucleoside-diphosphate-sugar epimerase